jgi:ring-1,2-phenylacetyl-CoA epoxidase subunit PaaB
VQAINPEQAMATAKNQFKAKIVFNIWAVRTADIRFTKQEEKDLWVTLPEKKFRDAADYKGGDKLKEFLERNSA